MVDPKIFRRFKPEVAFLFRAYFFSFAQWIEFLSTVQPKICCPEDETSAQCELIFFVQWIKFVSRSTTWYFANYGSHFCLPVQLDYFCRTPVDSFAAWIEASIFQFLQRCSFTKFLRDNFRSVSGGGKMVPDATWGRNFIKIKICFFFVSFWA